MSIFQCSPDKFRWLIVRRIPAVTIRGVCGQSSLLRRDFWGWRLESFSLPGWPVTVRVPSQTITWGIPLLTPNCRGNFLLLVKNEIETSCRPTKFYFLCKEKVNQHASGSKWRKTLNIRKLEHLCLRKNPPLGCVLHPLSAVGSAPLLRMSFHTLVFHRYQHRHPGVWLRGLINTI